MTDWQIVLAMTGAGVVLGALINISVKMDEAVKLLKQIDSRDEYQTRQALLNSN